MNKEKKLLSGDLFADYDLQNFLDAVNDSYNIWRENDLYEKRVANKDSAPENITDIEDLYNIPVIDMAEFKTDVNVKNHPLAINKEAINPKCSLYSSGTSTGTQGVAPKSKKGYELHKKSFQKLYNTIFPEKRKTIAINLFPQEIMQSLPIKQKNKAVMNYVKWAEALYVNSFEVLDLKEGEPSFKSKGMVEFLTNDESNKNILILPKFI